MKWRLRHLSFGLLLLSLPLPLFNIWLSLSGGLVEAPSVALDGPNPLHEAQLNSQRGSMDVNSVGDGTSAFSTSPKVHSTKVHDRIFLPWRAVHNTTLPCFPPDFNLTDNKKLKSPATQGLFFLKLLKTGSTTGSGVHLRIAKNLARRVSAGNYTNCKTRHLHGWASGRMYKYRKRNRAESFLWTVLRHPTDRYVSEFFHFQVARRNVSVTDEKFIRFLRHGKHADHHYLSWLSSQTYWYGSNQTKNWRPFANGIMNDYDFIAIMERFDESLVVLMMLLGLPMSDILYVSAKRSGDYDDGQFKGKCFKIQRSYVPPAVQQYFESSKWKDYIEPELELYHAANRSLDRTIDTLGKGAVEANLVRFREAQQVVEKRCGPERVRLPCTEEGVKLHENETDCLSADMGCGFDCLDEIATEMNLS